MITTKEIKQRSIIAAIEKYKKEIELILISNAIILAADEGKFMIYFDAKAAKIKRDTWTAILNAFDNVGFKTGIKNEKLLISWFSDLEEIDLLENYEKERPY